MSELTDEQAEKALKLDAPLIKRVPGLRSKKSRKRNLLIFAIIVVVLIATGLTAFFLWPRQPTVYYYMKQNEDDFYWVPTLMVELIHIKEAIKVDNPNYYRMDIEFLRVFAYFNGTYLGEGKTASSTSIPARSFGKQITMDMKIRNGPFFVSTAIDQMCNSPGDFFDLEFRAVFGVRYLASVDYLTLSFQERFDCSGSSEQQARVQ